MAICIFPASEVAYVSVVRDGVAQLFGKEDKPFSSLSCFIPGNSVNNSIRVCDPFRSMLCDYPFSFSLFGPRVDGRLVQVLKSAAGVSIQQKSNGDIQYVHANRTVDVDTFVKAVLSNILTNARKGEQSLNTVCFVIPDHYSVLKRQALMQLVSTIPSNENVQVKLMNQSAAVAACCMKSVSNKCNKMLIRIDTEGVHVGIYSMDRNHATPLFTLSDMSITEVDVLKKTLEACIKRIESVNLVPALKRMDADKKHKEECRYLEMIRQLYADMDPEVSVELSDGEEEEVKESDCIRAIEVLSPILFNLIENCLLLSNMSMDMIDGIVLSGCTMGLSNWNDALKKYHKDVVHVRDSTICCSALEVVAGMAPAAQQCCEATYSVGIGNEQVLCIPSGTCFPSKPFEKTCALSYENGVGSKDLLVLEQRYCDKSPVVIDRKTLDSVRDGAVHQLQVGMSLRDNGLVVTEVKESKKATDV